MIIFELVRNDIRRSNTAHKPTFRTKISTNPILKHSKSIRINKVKTLEVDVNTKLIPNKEPKIPKTKIKIPAV